MNEFLGTRVLVVDDDRLIREMTCDALVEEGFEVATAGSGSAALEKLRVDGPFDIVITDLSMREMDGLELMESIRRAHSKTDVIILTGYASLESALQAMRLGAADYLRKPVAPPEIIYAIKRTVIRRSILDENQSLHGFLDTFEAARLLTGCLEACDVLPMLLDILLRVLGRKRAVGRLDLPLPRPGDGVRLCGFEGEDALRLRAALEGGKIFDPRTIEPDDGATAAITEWRGRPDSLAEVAPPDVRLLALPLRLDGERVGGVWVFDDGEAFVPDDVRRAEVVIAQAELALINAERFIQAREKAFVDDVTELYNARYLMAALDREAGRAQRSGLDLSVLFLDLDRFKLVNDSHGHLIGSRVLKEFGDLLLASIRSIDTVARYGGDEFTIVLVDTGHDMGCDVANRILTTVRDHRFAGDLGLQLTVSIGVASFPRHGTRRESLLASADKAMYLAKSRGRDHVCSADGLEEQS